LIQQLAPFASTEFIKKNQPILLTGEKNDSLYILLEGGLDVIVQGEKVAYLNERGSIVGELSIISSHPCNADVIANSDSKLLKTKINDLKDHIPDYQVLLYKIFCLTLSEKLIATNLKAIKFETLNRTLEEEVSKRTNDLKMQNAELTLSFKKLESMHAENMLIVNKLSAIDDDLIKSTLTLADSKSLDDKKEIIVSNLKLIQQSLSPIKSLRKEQENLEGQKVLVVEANVKQRNMIKIALGGTGVKVDIAKSIEEAKELLLLSSYNILFLSTKMLEIADFVKDNQLKVKIVLSTEEESKDYIGKIKSYGFLSNIIATKQDDRASNIKSLSTTVSKMTSGDIFGLEKYLNWGVDVKELEVSDSAERQSLNDKVADYLTDLGIKNSIKTRCQAVIEELLMNAIYDAPVDSNGSPLHNHKTRRDRIILEDGQKGKLKFATDGLYLAISVEDPFGEFKKETIFTYLEENYCSQGDEIVIRPNKGGAGKGLFIISENSDLVIYNVARGRKTEVIVLFDLDPLKEKKTTSLHYFEL
jgi:CheY-like chemotaxis protein